MLDRRQTGGLVSRTLYDQEHGGTRVILRAERNEDGAFVIAGQDLGELPQKMFGDTDYEYWYTFDPKQEQLLISTLRRRLTDVGIAGGDDTTGIEELLAVAFGSKILGSPPSLTSFLKDAGIEFAFSSYA
jgi:hypothetical protein